ncbi:MAG: ATP-binding cassette domain-containing protein [Bacteroidia bacterium]|nr:ATP-binding cassette domain-containing protein [Bacteroidia bacterium]
MLVVSKLRKQFSTVLAVDDVSFAVSPGQIFGLIGPNGAGKTTTIRMIMDIIQPDAGSVTIQGQAMSARAMHLVGYLPEERGLYRKNKLLNVITYFGMLKGMSARDVRVAAMPLLERFSLLPYLKRNVEELSKGNQQKVQFIISILHKPSLLVLDELFSGLDPVNQVLMKEALIELRKDGRAIIFSTHQMEQAEKLCDELLMINHGQTVLHGAPTSIKAAYGRNALQVEFQGDGTCLRDIPGVLRADIAQRFAELELAPDTRTNDVIAAMLPLLDVSSVSRVEPSLQSIFIDIAGQPPPEAETAPAHAEVMVRTAVLKDRTARKHFFTALASFAAMLVFAAIAASGENLWQAALALLFAVRGAWGLLQLHKRKKALLDDIETKEAQA